MYLKKALFLLSLLLITNFAGAYAQDKILRMNPYEVMASWTFEDVIKEFGEGENIIDTMSGQAYISGFRYNESWLEKPCELEFYFADVNVSRFLLRFIHPNNALLEEENKKNDVITSGTGMLESKTVPDSIWVKRIKDNPGIFDSLKTAWAKEFVYRKSMLEKDSLRGDSIIRDVAKIFGEPLREGPTPHTDKDSRYFATWIKNGYSCSVKDYRRFTEINFGISPAPGAVITEFNLDPGIKLIEKLNMNIRGKNLEVSLLGLPQAKGSIYFDRLFLLASTPSRGFYLNELPEERQSGFNPQLVIKDLTGDGIPDVWLKVLTGVNGACSNNFIYTLELMEPLLIFDPLDDLIFELEGEFQDDFNAMIIIDGAERSHLPLDKNKPEYKSIFNENGKLLKKVQIYPGCLERIEAKKYKSSKGTQITGHVPIHGVSDNDIIGYLLATWDYQSGGWELRSLEIWQD